MKQADYTLSRKDRMVALFLLPLGGVLVITGLTILAYWPFPIVEMIGDTELISQNPIGFGLLIVGTAILAVSSVSLVRVRKAALYRKSRST